MAKVEVEHRGRLSKDKFLELKSFFDKKGTFLGKKDRFSVIYSQNKEEKTEELSHSPIDLKVRITNKKEELVMKHGDWSGNDARREFCFGLEKGKFEEMVEFLKILGHYHGVLHTTRTYLYHYKEVEFSLVEVPGWGYYFEAEVLIDSSCVEETNKRIRETYEELGMEALDHQAFCELLQSLNERPGYKFNFKKQSFSEIKKRFAEFF